MGSQVVDTLTAEEFMQQALQKVSADELRAITASLQVKHDLFVSSLGDGSAVEPEGLRSAVKRVFGMRRRGGEIVDAIGEGALCEEVARLFDARVSVPERFDTFVARLAPHTDAAADLASELLHFTQPDRYWLWSRWMWDPATETGALRLVTMDEFDLAGETPGATYIRVGEAVAFAAETGRAVGFTSFGATPVAAAFSIDVFLACVYGIYMYTVLRMRMTQEFNNVVPQLPELARRLLGVYRMEAA